MTYGITKSQWVNSFWIVSLNQGPILLVNNLTEISICWVNRKVDKFLPHHDSTAILTSTKFWWDPPCYYGDQNKTIILSTLNYKSQMSNEMGLPICRLPDIRSHYITMGNALLWFYIWCIYTCLIILFSSNKSSETFFSLVNDSNFSSAYISYFCTLQN